MPEDEGEKQIFTHVSLSPKNLKNDEMQVDGPESFGHNSIRRYNSNNFLFRSTQNWWLKYGISSRFNPLFED